jgi:hypothetical protein
MWLAELPLESLRVATPDFNMIVGLNGMVGHFMNGETISGLEL